MAEFDSSGLILKIKRSSMHLDTQPALHLKNLPP